MAHEEVSRMEYRGAACATARSRQSSKRAAHLAAITAVAAALSAACGSKNPDAPPSGVGAATGGTDGGATDSASGSTGASTAATDSSTSGTTTSVGTTSASTGGSSITVGTTGAGVASAAQIATKLGRPPHFLIGMGNDLADNHDNDGAYTLGTTVDLHYAYLVGLPGSGGWPDWNTGGTFVNILSDSAQKHGVVPMYTLYAMAARGDGNLAGLGDDTFMGPYWDGAKLLFQRIAAFDGPAVVHIEPDFWAYAEQQSHEDPTSMKVRISGLAADCAGQPESLVGLGHCLIKLARMYAPKAVVGFHASEWAGTPANMIKFLTAVGATDGDIIVQDMLDRDAGCFEAAVDPNCMRQGTFYWDESNQTSPNFHDHFAYAKQISDGLGKPILWWQVPFGVPSATPGGTAGHYRDNRVHYIFNHIDELIAAGGLGVTFGTGAGNQTYITTDGDQFKNSVKAYFAAPVTLP